MDLYELFNSLRHYYKELNPHHDTWILWTKPDKTLEEIFEVVIGTILVQNTNWKNVDKAINQLKKNNIFTFAKILECGDEQLIELIKPAGFYNQKIVYLRGISELFTKKDWNTISRSNLLSTKGIGKETADSILNYCLEKPYPIVGTYTKRFFAKYLGKKEYLKYKYESIQTEIFKAFSHSELKSYDLGLFHALIVVHSQNLCIKRDPKCHECFLNKDCIYNKDKNIANLLKSIINPIKKNKS